LLIFRTFGERKGQTFFGCKFLPAIASLVAIFGVIFQVRAFRFLVSAIRRTIFVVQRGFFATPAVIAATTPHISPILTDFFL
jgi:hypothetical protein